MQTRTNQTGASRHLCRRLWFGCGRNLSHSPHSFVPSCYSHTSDIHHCGDHSFSPHGRRCGRYTGRVCRAAARRPLLQGHHRNPPDRCHSENLEGDKDMFLYCGHVWRGQNLLLSRHLVFKTLRIQENTFRTTAN